MYYISSSESYSFEKPRKIEIIEKFIREHRTFLVAKLLEDPIIGQGFGYGDKDFEEIILLARYKGEDLSNLGKLPINIYILLPTLEFNWEIFNKDQLKMITWATLYDNLKDAQEHK